MKTFKGRTAVITGAASGFGLETCRIAAREGMNVVMADVQPDALELAAREIRGLGAQVLPARTDVSKAADIEALGAASSSASGCTSAMTTFMPSRAAMRQVSSPKPDAAPVMTAVRPLKVFMRRLLVVWK